ncbi:helix-turn-helix domain-containing protein [Paraburkholderia bannensis]|uniref:helix-turn-helix domain-containing protein n=1 Tax=Paraburkholderia bannensis TaxID=765414 RepID=UPI002AC3208A|nr:helix-turn-helix domain-containing protein [Paraburkholderia bannensis]
MAPARSHAPVGENVRPGLHRTDIAAAPEAGHDRDIRGNRDKRDNLDNDPMVVPLARGLAILCVFGRGRAWLGNLDIALETGIPAPTVSRLIHSLLVLGYVQQDESTRMYALAPAALALGYAAIADVAPGTGEA